MPVVTPPRKTSLILAAAAALAAGAVGLVATPARAQLSPEESIKTLKVPDGLEATLFATEPDLVNPTDMDIDAKGRVWVLEAANYRRFKTRPEGDRIVVLEDTNGDGKADKTTVFYQDPSLFAPLGIAVLGDKVYVAQSPNVLVFDIDDSASAPKAKGKPTVLFTGFTGENHDHGVHAGVFGPDGRYYFNSGNEGTHALVTTGDGKPVVDSLGSEIGSKSKQYRGKEKAKGELGYVEGMAFRCDPDGKNFETLGYNFRNNYELTVDSFGTVWQSDNDDDGNQGVRINYVMEGGNFGYKGPKGSAWNRDQELIKGQTRQQAHWHQLWPGVVPNLLHTGGGSPTGITVYEGDLLPEQYHGALIHCDAGPNVVRAYMTEPSRHAPTGLMAGLASKDKVADSGPAAPVVPATDTAPGAGYKVKTVVELAKGKDSWIRPADVCVAPDGSLFIADWYDPGVGGHNMQDKEKGAKDPHDWHNLRGRVYRLAPTGSKYTTPKVELGTTAGQIAALKSPNFATRYLAWNALHAGGPEAVKALEQEWNDKKNPRFRARALWLLARSADGKKYVEAALKDADPDLRVTAIRAARLIKMDMAAVAGGLMNDDSPLVARELCLAMNYAPADKAVPVLVKLADKYDGKDRWYLEALGIGATGKEEQLLAAWEKGHQNKDAGAEKLIVWRLKMEAPQAAPAAGTASGKQASAVPARDGGAVGPFVPAAAPSR